MTDDRRGGGELEELREQVYVDPRPQEQLQPYYDWSRTREPDWMYSLVRVVTSLYAWTFFRTTTIDARNIPTSGPLICAPNHSSNIDHFFLGAATRRKVQFMAKSQLFKGPQTFMYRHGGVFPIQRGKRDEQSFEVAKAILAREGTICIYSEGGRSRTGKLADKPKAGIGRMALETGATVLPIAIHGSARVRNWKRLQFPKVTVQYGEPLRFEVVEHPTREQQQAAAEEIFARIKALYAELEARLSG